MGHFLPVSYSALTLPQHFLSSAVSTFKPLSYGSFCSTMSILSWVLSQCILHGILPACSKEALIQLVSPETLHVANHLTQALQRILNVTSSQLTRHYPLFAQIYKTELLIPHPPSTSPVVPKACPFLVINYHLSTHSSAHVSCDFQLNPPASDIPVNHPYSSPCIKEGKRVKS